MAFAENLGVFFQTADFAVAVLVNGAATVNGIFEAEYADPFGDGLVGSVGPVLWVPTAAAIANGDVLTINGVAYTARNPRPDGTGVSRIRLQAP
jgi:hypothetical protein